jgi:hypothetical protein
MATVPKHMMDVLDAMNDPKPTDRRKAQAPYLSDAKLLEVVDSIRSTENVEVDMERTAMLVRAIYEERRDRDSDLIQRFVDHNAKWAGKGCLDADMEWDAIVSDCIAYGFKPSI